MRTRVRLTALSGLPCGGTIHWVAVGGGTITQLCVHMCVFDAPWGCPSHPQTLDTRRLEGTLAQRRWRRWRQRVGMHVEQLGDLWAVLWAGWCPPSTLSVCRPRRVQRGCRMPERAWCPQAVAVDLPVLLTALRHVLPSGLHRICVVYERRLRRLGAQTGLDVLTGGLPPGVECGVVHSVAAASGGGSRSPWW